MWTNTDPERRGRQDAGQEYSEPGGEVQGFCVRAGALARRGVGAGAGGGGAGAGASSGSLFGVRGAAAGVRPLAGARVRIRAAVGNAGVLRLCPASRAMSRLRSEGGGGALGAGEADLDAQLDAVSGHLGAAGFLAGSGATSHFLGEGFHSVCAQVEDCSIC